MHAAAPTTNANPIERLTRRVGQHSCVSSASLRLLAHVAMAAALLTIRRDTETVQYGHYAIIRKHAVFPTAGRSRAQPVRSESESTDLDYHLGCTTTSLLPHSTGYINRERPRRQKEKTCAEDKVSVCYRWQQLVELACCRAAATDQCSGLD